MTPVGLTIVAVEPVGIAEQRRGNRRFPARVRTPEIGDERRGVKRSRRADGCREMREAGIELRIGRADRFEILRVARRDETAQAGFFAELLADDRVGLLARGVEAR